MTKFKLILGIAVLAAAAATVPAIAALGPDDDHSTLSSVAIGTGITYQGRLLDAGAPANGLYDLRFVAYDAEVGGTQFGVLVTKEDVSVTNGLFTTLLDFGPDTFKADQRWVEMAVKPGSGGTFTVLSPRQIVGAVPYALYAREAGLGLPVSASAANATTTGLFSITQTDAGPVLVAKRTYVGSVEYPAVNGVNSGAGAGVQGESTFAAGMGVLGSATGVTGVGGKFSGATGARATGVGVGATALEIENGAIKVSGVTKPAFVHKALAANIGTNYTVIDNPLTNADPNAILIVTPNYNPSGGAGVSYAPPLGVQYLGALAPETHRNKWAIFNEDATLGFPVNASFNVLVIKQ